MSVKQKSELSLCILLLTLRSCDKHEVKRLDSILHNFVRRRTRQLNSHFPIGLLVKMFVECSR